MLAIVFGCERFHYYIYGREFAVITDHKPLEMITKKSLEKAPAILQRMMLRIQTYNYTVTYSPGNTMTLADTLSRQPDADNAAHIDLDVAITPIQFSTERLNEIRDETNSDEELILLKTTINNGWPKDIKQIPNAIKKY